MDDTYIAKLSDQKIEIPQGLSQEGNNLFASTYATCADWCDEVCYSGNECSQGCTCAGQNDQNPCTCSNQGGQCTCNNQGGQCTCSNQVGQSSGSPPSGVPTIKSVTVTSNSISFAWSTVSGATYYQIAYRLSTTSSATYEAVYGTSTTISGLRPNTDYVINVRACNSYGNGSFGSGRSVTTSSDRPSNWYWWSTVASGGPISISASEWNAFCDNINEVREYMGYPAYGAGDFGSVKRGDPISASTVNHAVWAIGAIKNTAMNYEVSSGDPITASFFNGLKNVLNSIT